MGRHLLAFAGFEVFVDESQQFSSVIKYRARLNRRFTHEELHDGIRPASFISCRTRFREFEPF